MENSVALVKPKLTTSEKKIIAMVIDGLPSENSRRAYQRHLQEFFVWHADEERPELNKALINRYVKSLRARKLSSATINQKLSAIRKLASEAEDNNLLDSKIANGIRAVKGVPFRGRRTGNWLTKEDAQKWLNAPDVKKLKGVRDRALLAVLIGCGLRRAEASILSFHHIVQREGRWAIVDIVGKRDKMRTVPMPSWAKATVDAWKSVAHLEEGFVFRRVNKGDNLMGESITPQAIRDIVAGYAVKLENQGIAPHDLRRTFAKLAHKGGSPIDQIQLSLGHDSIQTTEKYLGVEQDLTDAPCDHLGLRIGPTMDYAETITAERVRRVMNGYGENSKAVEGLGGAFDFYEIGDAIFLEDGNLNESIGIEEIRRYVAFSENISADKQLSPDNEYSPYLLGLRDETAYFFIYEKDATTTLDLEFLANLPFKPKSAIIYADNCLLTREFLQNHNLIFKKIPRDITRF